jgi:hypothetical protein
MEVAMRCLRLLLALSLAASTAAAASAATSPGPLGPEGVPIPKGPVFADVQVVHLGEKIDGIPCQTTEKLTYHVHAHLTLFANGKAYQVPYGIGIGPPLAGQQTSAGPFVTSGSCIMWMHTHASDGIIHMEAPTARGFTLGEFMDIWGLKLTSKQVGPHSGTVTAFYDGKQWKGDPRNIPLANRTEVQLDVGSPVVPPEHITFPPGLGTSTGK